MLAHINFAGEGGAPFLLMYVVTPVKTRAVIPAKAGIHKRWIPAPVSTFVEMTTRVTAGVTFE
jgi:hypothetical protein